MKIKKIFLPFIAGALAISLAACSGDDKAKEEKAPETTQDEQAAAEEVQAKLAEQQVDAKKIVAIVNDEELNGEQYNAALSSIQVQMQRMGQDPTNKEAAEQIKIQTLDTLVNQTLLLQQAKGAEIEATEAEVEEEYEAFAKQVGDEEALKKVLESQKMDVETLKKSIAESIIFNKYTNQVAPAGEVTDEEIKEYYDQAAAQAKESEQELPPFEEASEDIKAILEQEQQQEKLIAHVEELKEKAKIEFKI